ncbi:MAG: molecular chaperone [Candidatus Tectimicrobiota bacterium]|nr:MAG: molecular chaperone [Candidatus Tectomicrobia bacterium]
MADLWETMEALRREIDRAFEDFGFRTEPFFRTAFLPGRAARRYPLVNIYADRDALYVEALAPGVDPASLDISVLRNTLTLAGEKRRVPEDVRPEAFHRSERATGRFVRTIELPLEVDENNVRADYKNGLLVVTLPKAERVKPKQINVQVS